MPRWLKVSLVVVLVFLLLAGGIIGAGVIWVVRNKDALIANAKAREREAAEQGKQSGRQTDNQGCLEQAVSRCKQNSGFFNATSTAIFLRSCLDSSRTTPGFCDNVPKQSDRVRSPSWISDQCDHEGLSRLCGLMFEQVQYFCDEKADGSKAERN